MASPAVKQAPFAAARLISGPTGSGKTSLIATLATYVWEKYRRTTLYYSCDPGGFTERLQALIVLGIVLAWRVQTRGEAFETLARATEGYWPEVLDPTTGACARGAKLLPPMLTEFTMFCAKDDTPVLRVPVANLVKPLLCGKCGQMVKPNDKSTSYVRKAQSPSPTFNPPGRPPVGAVAFDGITSMSDWLMLDMADRTARGELVGEKTALGGKIRSGEMEFGGSNRSHYGFAQVMAEKLIKNSITIPGLVVPPLWTALESRVDETGTELAEYGPAIAGQAKTKKVPQWVGDYMGTVVVTDKDGRHFRLFTTEYRGEDGVAHRYKTRTEPGVLLDYYEDGPGETPFTTFSLARVMRDMETSLGATVEKLKVSYPDAPGMATGPQVTPQANDPRIVVAVVGDNSPPAGRLEGSREAEDGAYRRFAVGEGPPPGLTGSVGHQAPRASAGNEGFSRAIDAASVKGAGLVRPPAAGPAAARVPVAGGRLPQAVAPSARRPGQSQPAGAARPVAARPEPVPAGGGDERAPVAPDNRPGDAHPPAAGGPPTVGPNVAPSATMHAPGAPPAAPRPPKRAAVAAPDDAGAKG